MKDKEDVTIFNDFQNILDGTNRKGKKIWVDKGSEFYYRSVKSWLQGKDIEMNSTDQEGKSVVLERLIRTLANKIYKYMISISKKVYIDKLGDIVNEYHNKSHITIKTKDANVNSRIYFDFNLENNNKYVKLEIGDHVRRSKYKNNFAKKLHSKLVWRNFWD